MTLKYTKQMEHRRVGQSADVSCGAEGGTLSGHG